jgi:proteasome accessory factor A
VPRPLVMGMETEYAVTGIPEGGEGSARSRLIERMLSLARNSYPHLRDWSSQGLFLANGARLYVDRGEHPEFATPECQDPWEVLRYVRAGEALLLSLARQARWAGEFPEVAVLRANVDYLRGGTTWGCHESYLHRSDPADLPPHLIPHLVSRVVYTGAGGFNPVMPGLEFTLSPRAWLISEPVSAESTQHRGIYHTKDESLSGPGWHRLHVICGESLCSDTATVLKLGATALVVAALEAGHRPGQVVGLARPVDALRAFASDPGGRATARLVTGADARACDIQRHYLELVERCLADAVLPPWAGEICRMWRAQLDALDDRAASVARTLDWAIKLALYQDQAARCGLDWEAFSRWNLALRDLDRAASRLHRQDEPHGLGRALGLGSAPHGKLRPLAPRAVLRGMRLREVNEFLAFRRAMLETDLRFGQLGERGIFDQLEGRGVLTHGVEGHGPVHGWVDGPPERGRARARGEWITRLWRAGTAARYRCDWASVSDEARGLFVDLSDPLAHEGLWERAMITVE